ncbi:MAG TPA: hypothetical protein VM841_15490 [Actinomycetota bacterium]|nr:hypothetical protein [Actinomycetota bacterium]
MSVRRRLIVIAGSLAALAVVALYPRTDVPSRVDLLAHGYSYGTGYAASCPTSLSLGVTSHKVVSGSPMSLNGQLLAEPGFSVSGQPIQFYQAVFSSTSFTQISGAVTDSTGSYVKVGWPSLNATYKTKWGPLGGPPTACPEVNSGRATVLVYVRVPWLFDRQPVAGQSTLLYGSVRPLHPGQRIHFMYKRLDDRNFRFSSATMDTNSNFFVPFVFDRPGRWYMRVSFYDLDPFHEGNYTAKIFNVR